MRIAIIEDNSVFVKVMWTYLQGVHEVMSREPTEKQPEQYWVVGMDGFDGPSEVVTVLDQFKPEVILLDHELRAFTGRGVLDKLKQCSWAEEVKVVGISSAPWLQKYLSLHWEYKERLRNSPEKTIQNLIQFLEKI